MRFLIVLLIAGAALAQKAPAPAPVDAQNAFSRQCEVRRLDISPATESFLALLKAGPTAAGFSDLGESYFKSGKLVQSVAAFERALKLDPKLEAAVKGHLEASQLLNKRNDRIKELEAREALEKDARLVCSRAAIVFHLGFMGDAINILHSAEHLGYKNDEELRLLENTLKMGLNVDKAVLRAVLEDFFKAVEEKKLDAALLHLGEYQVFSMGTGNTVGLVEKIGATFGEPEAAKINAVL